MDQSLDDIKSDRNPEQQNRRNARRGNDGGRPRPRRDGWPNNGVGKVFKYARDSNENWVHDRFEDSPAGGRPQRNDRRGGNDRRGPEHGPEGNAELEVSNLHYDLSEDDLRNLFKQCGEVLSVRIRFDRAGRSEGTARVRYSSIKDAESAIERFDGANAYGQPITLKLIHTPAQRSIFDRISGVRQPQGKEPLPISRNKSQQIDRYVPGEKSEDGEARTPREPREPREPRRHPIRERERRGGDRRGGDRRGGGRRGRRERPAAPAGGTGARPRKTVEELDQEMSDYWGAVGANGDQTAEGGNGDASKAEGNAAPAEQHFDDGDAMMVE